jgi:hypothetical protein
MPRSLVQLPFVLLIASSCSHGSGGNPGPIVAFAFPPPAAWTEAESMVVSGSATDPDGVDEVRVDGVLATTTDGGDEAILLDGGRLLAMDLATGIRRIVADEAHGSGPDLRQSATFATVADLALVVGREGNTATVWSVDLASGDRAILSVDLHTGQRVLASR